MSIPEFMFDEKHGRAPISESKDSYVCGLTGKKVAPQQQKKDHDYLARALAKEFGWEVNSGSEFDKVIGIFALNTIDVMTLSWAVHRLNGISSPANAAYSPQELQHQLENSEAKALFTVLPLLKVALAGAEKAGIPRDRIYLLPMPSDDQSQYPKGMKTYRHLLDIGRKLPELEPLKWTEGQGARQTAFLCYSSGTSGLPKGVMISHRNVIANTLQIMIYEDIFRKKLGKNYKDVALGLLPQSHIYALIVICHCSTYRGDSVVVLPRFDLQSYLKSIQTYKINTLYLVPPIIIQMVKQKETCARYDLSSVTAVFTGAAPLGAETAVELNSQYPKWKIRQGYGLTETCTVVCSSQQNDIWFGSSGCLLPGFKVRLLTPEDKEVTEYNKPGELLVQSPSIVLGYLKNDKANEETFVELEDGRYMRTGDEAEIRKSPETGSEHVWIVDRIKELIKVKVSSRAPILFFFFFHPLPASVTLIPSTPQGLQVAPAELEATILSHPLVADCAVIPVDDDAAGQVPKAYVVVKQPAPAGTTDESLQRDIQEFVQREKARHKWLKGGVEQIDVIPKSPSGKILRRLLRDKERAARKKREATKPKPKL